MYISLLVLYPDPPTEKSRKGLVALPCPSTCACALNRDYASVHAHMFC